MNPEAKRRFELEALEPRILLSGDGLGAVAGSVLQGASGTFQDTSQLVVQQDPSSTGPMFSSQLEYVPAGQLDDIFGGMADEKTGPSTPASDHSADTSATGDSGEEVTAQTTATGTEIHSAEVAAAPSDFSSAVSTADSPSATSQTDISHPQTQRLTVTLRASNAPPVEGADFSLFTVISKNYLLLKSMLPFLYS